MDNETKRWSLELRCWQRPPAISTIDAILSGEPHHLSELKGKMMFDLNILDPRLKGQGYIGDYSQGSRTAPLRVNGAVEIDGRNLAVGDHARLSTGGPVDWDW